MSEKEKNPSLFVMPFGKFKGKTLGEIGKTGGGATYLNWLSSERDIEDSAGKHLKEFLGIPEIKEKIGEKSEELKKDERPKCPTCIYYKSKGFNQGGECHLVSPPQPWTLVQRDDFCPKHPEFDSYMKRMEKLK